MQILVSDFSFGVMCDLRWELVPDGLISIRCGPRELEPARMHLYGEIVGLTGGLKHPGRLGHTVLNVKGRRYGARGDWAKDGRRVYTLTPATIDPNTNGLVYEPRATAVAAVSFDREAMSIGVKTGTADAQELALAARVLVTVTLLGLHELRPDTWCGKPVKLPRSASPERLLDRPVPE
jgi:hypothetical protein